MSDRLEMEAVFEAILFAASDPVPRAELLAIFRDSERGQAEEGLAAVLERYRKEPGRGISVEEVAGGLRLATAPELSEYLKRYFDSAQRGRLSVAALETLAIVAYRQPITAPEIQELRGVNPSGVLKTLLERRLIRVAGRRQVVGKPFIYRTTREFLMQFGLNALDDLPDLEEFEELVETSAGESEPLFALDDREVPAAEGREEDQQGGLPAPEEEDLG